MENSIKILENEIEKLQDLIKCSMEVHGSYAPVIEKLIGEHLTAIEKLKSVG